jgi:hypothetical protein
MEFYDVVANIVMSNIGTNCLIKQQTDYTFVAFGS